MRKLREVLRLRFELKLGYQQIGRSCAIGVSTVHRHLKEEYRQGNPEGFSGRVKRTFHALGSPGHRAYRRFTYSHMHVSAQ